MRKTFYYLGLVMVMGILLGGVVNAESPTSTNYQIRGYGFGAGGLDDGSSTNYRLHGILGEVSEERLTGNNTLLGPGLVFTEQANVPPAPTFVNEDDHYNRLLLTINTGNNPSDAIFAVAISTDGFSSETKFVKSDSTVGDTLELADYRTFAGWGGASGDYVIGLEPETTYTVKVKAMHGDFTETDFGPTTSAITTNVVLRFDIDVAETDQKTDPPHILDLGTLPADTVITSQDKIWVDFETNADHGGRVYVSGRNGGLQGESISYTINSLSGDLGLEDEGFGAQGHSVTEGGGGPFSFSTLYDKSGDNVGIIDSTLREMFISENPITDGRGSFLVKGKSSSITPAASDYAEIITIIASASF